MLLAQWRPERIHNRHQPIFNLIAIISGTISPESLALYHRNGWHNGNRIIHAGMLAQLRDDTQGIRGLGKVNKVYLDNTNLVYILAGENANKGNIRETFFINQCRLHHHIVSSNVADFKIEDKDFEIGGKNKGLKQIKTAENGFLVKDDIESGFFNTIPLWYFGLMY